MSACKKREHPGAKFCSSHGEKDGESDDMLHLVTFTESEASDLFESERDFLRSAARQRADVTPVPSQQIR